MGVFTYPLMDTGHELRYGEKRVLTTLRYTRGSP